HDTITDAERARLLHQDATEIIDQVLLLSFDQQKTVRDQFAKHQALLFASRSGNLRRFAPQLIERKRFEIVELRENLRDRRRGVTVNAKLLECVFLTARWFLGFDR